MVIQFLRKNVRYLLPLLVLVMFLSGCQIMPAHHIDVVNADDNTVHQQVKASLMKEYDVWKNVPYRFGGESRRGIDCSALVQKVYEKAFELKLPRTTYYLRNVGQHVKRNELQVGDLVLFQIARNDRHVGIYLGNDKFMHASSSRGVMISTLESNYWKKYYLTARRVLNQNILNEGDILKEPIASDAG